MRAAQYYQYRKGEKMGMFDKPVYLTGEEGYVSPGEELWVHNARLEGTVNIGGVERKQAKLLVSREPNGERVVVLTSGAGIVGQVARMDRTDRNTMTVGGGMHVRLDEIPSRQGNPTRVLTPAHEPPPENAITGSGSDEDVPF